MPGDDRLGHWQFVNGHSMLLQLSSIEAVSEASIDDNSGDNAIIPDDGSISDDSSTQPSSDDGVTNEDKSAVNDSLDMLSNDAQTSDEPNSCCGVTDESTDDETSYSLSGDNINIIDPKEISQYSVICNGNLSIIVKTNNDGSAQTMCDARKKIVLAKKLHFTAVDQTVWSQK